MIDSVKLGRQMAVFMEEIERDYGDDARLGDFMLVAEVQRESVENDPDDTELKTGKTTDTVVLSSDPRNHVQIGLLRSALLEVER